MNKFIATLKYSRPALMLRGKKLVGIMTDHKSFTQYLADGGNPNVQINKQLALQGLGWDLEKLEMLLKSGANPNLKNQDGVGCIEFMIDFCEVQVKKFEVHDYLKEEVDGVRQHAALVVEMLLEYGANPEALTNRNSKTLVTASALSQNHYITEVLVRAGAVVDSSILHWAVRGQYEGLCTALAEKLELDVLEDFFSNNRQEFIEEKILPIVEKRQLSSSVVKTVNKNSVNKL